LLTYAQGRRWSLGTADITAAFLNGKPMERELYCTQPAEGLPGLRPGQLLRLLKDGFGLATAPRSWWEELSSRLQHEDFRDEYGETVRYVPSRFDPCLYVLRNSKGDTVSLLATHVDDLREVHAPGYERIRSRLQKMFPMENWDALPYQYVGCDYEQKGGQLVGQPAVLRGAATG
jgi:hypothetical protein